ncbi:skin granule protein precursor [Xenopus laevis]|uniref:Skin granule protein n=1 Tax=Xenopus laevis TaxID=8355 RepID=SKGR_XENLA|nr:skin granule protein precursor [Xenopus laevis]P13673.2 RecName: Full=Skin granule protein; Flags: Precursor [Xenopus laevis]CAA68806.1 skin granule preprotein (AA-26 to 187) [Xenopus laevis]
METMYHRFLCIPFLLILGLAQGQSKGLQTVTTFRTGLKPIDVTAIRTGLQPIATFHTGQKPIDVTAIRTGLQPIATFHTGLQPVDVTAIRTGLQPIATFQTGVQRVSTFHGEPASTLQGSGSTVIKKIMVSSMNQPVSKNEGIVEVPPPSGGTHVITEEMNWHGGRNGHKMKKLGKKKHHKNRHGGKNHHKMKKIGKHHGGGRKFGKKHRHHK